MRYDNTPQLKAWLSKDFPLLSAMPGFTFEDTEYDNHLRSLSMRPKTEQADAAAFRCLTHGFVVNRPIVNPSAAAIALGSENSSVLAELISTKKLVKWGILAILVTLWAIFGAIEAHAQSSNVAVVVTACGTPPTNIPAASAGSPNRVYLTVDTNGQICINGTITGGNAAAVPVAGMAPSANISATGIDVGGTQREVTGTNTSGAVYAIDTNCVAGCSGGTNDVDDGTIANGQTTGIQLPLNYVYDGTNWKRFTVGTAGSGSTQVITIQGNGSGTPVPVSGTVSVTGVAGTEYVQDVALTVATTQGGMAMGRASAAAPTNVSADDDAVLPWYLRSGAQAVQLTNAGVLTLSGSGTATGALRVELPTNGTGVIAGVTTVTTLTTLSQLGGTAVPVEDAAETAGGTGIYAMSVRRDTAASSANTTGDNATINTDAVGAVWTNIATPALIGVYVEDAAQTAGGNLMMAGAVRRDSAASSSTTDGDNSTLNTDSLGRLWVNCGTGCSGGTQYNIDSAAGATDTGTLTLAVRDDALSTLTPADGDYTQLRTNSTGALWVQSSIVDAAEDAAVATNPVPIGGVYRTASVTLDNGDVGYPRIDVDANLQIVGTGTAGTAAGGVLTVQGVASMTPLLVGDGSGAFNVICDSGCAGGTQYTQDGALTIATTIGTMAMGRASAAAPTGVSADDDAVLPWYLRSGAIVMQPSFAGVLGVSGSGNATGAMRVELANNGTGVLATVGAVTTVATVTTLSQLGGVALPIEDAAETPGGVGIYAMSVRRDAAASSATTDGDNATLNTDASGRLWVNCGTGCSGGTQYTQDAALTIGSTIGTMAMGRASAAVPADVSADNDAVLPWYLRSGALAVQPTFGGVLGVAGNGASGTGVQRVTIANDSTGILALTTGSAQIGHLEANQSVNVAQINGVTTLMGNGVTGTGSQRVTIASDNTAFSVNATLSAETTKVIGTARVLGNAGAAFDAATGAAPPANTVYVGGLTSGATGGFLTGIPVCDSQFNINIATATTTLAVTGVSGRHVRICGIDMVTAAANNVGIISGTGATCGTGSAAIVGTTAATGYNFAANGGIATGGGIGMIKRTVATGDSVCIITSQATQLSGTITYTIY